MPEKEVYTAIGLMSGTSLDGVDVAVLRTDGKSYVKSLAFLSVPYKDADRASIRAAFGKKDVNDDIVLEARDCVTRAHIEAIEQLLSTQNGLEIDLIGFHGQTIYHAPHDGITIQIGDAQALSEHFGVDVVYDFRSNDVSEGGEGAPLAPVYHHALMRSAAVELPCAVLNIGGVSNITYVSGESDALIALDCGPGNALIDDWIQKHVDARFDEDGAFARQGAVNNELLERWLGHDYFNRQPPKSLDRNEWDIAALGPVLREMSCSLEDGAATLTAFTVCSILKSLDVFPQAPKHIYVCGGGVHNKTMMAWLSRALGEQGIVISSIGTLGYNGDSIEAECFAYLGVRHILNLPISFPKTTGVRTPTQGGVLVQS